VQLLSSGIVLTSFIAGIVALLAPCCVSVMLPAYFASGLRHRRQIVGMTFVFAAGVGTVILPIALGASAVSGLLQSRHTPIFATGGALMILAGLATLAGRAPAVPMPFSAPLARPGTSGVWLLGVFSGAATACCAPVLAGVAGLAGAAGSFPLALTVGVAYVFGMVAPLALLALVWDLRDWGAALAPGRRTLSMSLGDRRVHLPLVNALAGGLLLVMGALTIASAVRGPGMGNAGWQVHLTGRINHVASQVEHGLAVLPGWVATSAVAALAIALAILARRMANRTNVTAQDPSVPHPPAAATNGPRPSVDAEPQQELHVDVDRAQDRKALR